MKLAVFQADEPGVRIVQLRYTSIAYCKGDVFYPGFMVAEGDDFELGSSGCYASEILAWELYGGDGHAAAAFWREDGSGYSWAILPENAVEAEHLAQYTHYQTVT